MKTFGRRTFLKGATALSAGMLASPAIVTAQEKTLVVGGPAGQADIYNKVIAPDFERKTGYKLLYDGSNSLTNLRKVEESKGNPILSVIMIDEPVMLTARDRGLLAKIDESELSNVKDMIPGSVKDGGLYINYKAPRSAIAYNSKIMKEPVTSWATAWEPQYRKKVLIPAMTGTTAVFLLTVAAHLKTGKPFAEAQYEVDAAFEKLAELKPNILTVYTSPSQIPALIDQGEAYMAAGLFTSYIVSRQKAGAPIELARPKEGSFALSSSMAMVKDAKNQEAAKMFVDLMLSAEYQKIFVDEQNDSPGNTKVALLPGMVPLNDMFVTDWAFVSKNRAEWIERYSRVFTA